MKKFITLVVLSLFILVGCDSKNDELDLSNSSAMKQATSEYNESQPYGKIIHRAELAKKITVKNIKAQEHVYVFAIAVFGEKKDVGISLVCDLRTDQSVITYLEYREKTLVPEDNLEISIMRFQKGTLEVRESDDAQDPVFSTANGDTELLEGLHKAATLPKDTLLGFVVDKETSSGDYTGTAWSPLFTTKQLLDALPDSASKCKGIPIDLEDVHFITKNPN